MKKIFIASDHAGFKLKKVVINYLKKKKISILDLGPSDDKKSVDYPKYAHKVSQKVSSRSSIFGILICGSGMGMSMAANKHKKIRAALCNNVKIAKLSRLHNNANIITLGSRLTNKKVALDCINTFLQTKFEGGRHLKRVKKI